MGDDGEKVLKSVISHYKNSTGILHV